MVEHSLERVFHPRSVAVVGVSTQTGGQRGPGFLTGLLDQHYQDHHPLYLVNPRATEINGMPCYRREYSL